jgi:tetratricopeptide (TPR) repeat protein
VSDSIFERYKQALKDGHVAVLRGRLEDALRHYRQAAELADSRPLPYSSLGGVLLRLGRVEEAIVAYDEALQRAPRDEAAMGGRSEALLSAGRRAEAAAVLDELAGIQASAGRRPESLATRGLARSIRSVQVAGADTPAPAPGSAPEAPAAEEAEPEPAEAEPEPPPEPEAAPPPSGAALLVEAERSLQAGDEAIASDRYVQAAEALAREGAQDAAIDACHQALGLAPGSAKTHLVLAQLYFARGWRDQAVEKLVLLDRLLELEPVPQIRSAMVELIWQQAPDEPRLAPVVVRLRLTPAEASGSSAGAHPEPPVAASMEDDQAAPEGP